MPGYTLTGCIDICIMNNYQYMGLQNDQDCFCGNNYNNIISRGLADAEYGVCGVNQRGTNEYNAYGCRGGDLINCVYIFGSSMAPSLSPSLAPTQPPSLTPTTAPSFSPSNAPSQSPSLAPSTAPSFSPSIAPTQPPTRYPTITDSYDSYFPVTYNISFEDESYTNATINLKQTVQDLEEIIERGYATNNKMKLIWFRDFWVNMFTINNYSISDLKQFKHNFDFGEQDLLIGSRVECSSHVCQEIFDNTDIQLFEKNVTKEMNAYFKLYRLQDLNANVDDLFNSEFILKFSISEMSPIQSHESVAQPPEFLPELFIPWWIWLLFITIVLLSILVIILYKYRVYKKQKQMEEVTINIYNPMVITVAIGFYDKYQKDKEIKGTLKDLEGVRADIDKAIKFFGDNDDEESLKYDVYPKIYFKQTIDNYKAWWPQQQLMEFLLKQAEELERNLKQYEISDNNRYDSLLVIISCHGIKGYIATSDYKKISKTAIHRIFSKKALSRKIPRLFLFDCCSGNDEREYERRESIDRESSDEKDS